MVADLGPLTSTHPLEVGERVLFRSLRWEVAEASDQVVRLYGREAMNQGVEVQVLPDLEPIERLVTPPLQYSIGNRGWSDADWRAVHDAYRLTLAQGRGSLGTAAWGRLVLEPYQLVPLQRIEQLPEPRLLIADDVGLGKTSEAGLIISRLLQRRRADRILIVTRARPEPERWRDEMLEKFGLEFAVINDGGDYARLRRTVPTHLNLYAAVPRLIASMHFLAQADRLPDLDRPGLRWDVAVIDEAHHVAHRGSDKRLARLGEVVAHASDALMLLTATPHDGKVRSFASLLELVDEYSVPDPDALQPTLIRPLVVRRLKTHVVRSDGSRFVPPLIEVIDVEPERTKEEHWLEKGIRSYANQLRKRQATLEAEGQRGSASAYGFLETLLRKRLASTVRACRETLLQRLSGGADGASETADDESNAAGLTELGALPNGKSERGVIEDLLKRIDRIPKNGEGKLQALARLVERDVADGEKVVIFTEFRDSLHAVVAMLAERGLHEEQDLLTYHGDTPNRDQVRRRFLTDPKIKVLVATDAASEGINLQIACNRLIHLEVPWNPNRYEQRNGRIDRYGQQRQARIVVLVARGYVEERAAEVVVTKLEQIGKDLGSVSNVAPIARAVSLEQFLVDHAGDDEGEGEVEKVIGEVERRLDAARPAGSEVPAEIIRGESFAQADLTRIEAELAAVKEFAPSFDDVRRFLERYLAAEHGQLVPLAEADLYRVVLPESLKTVVGYSEIPRATFERGRAVLDANLPAKDRVAFLSPGHPIVMTALRRARSWIYDSHFASRVSYRIVPADTPPAIVFTFAIRIVDGRGETVDERFETVTVRHDGTPGRSSDQDLRMFLTPSAGQPSDAERATYTKAALDRFPQLTEAANAEAARRAETRTRELTNEQRRVADDALLRLGGWHEKARLAVEQRWAPESQLSLLDSLAKAREALYQNRLKEVQAKFERRRREIEDMRELRIDSVEPVGALVLVPIGGWPAAS